MCLMETEWMEEGEAETGDICILFFSNVAPLSWEVPDAFIKFFSRKKLDFTKNRIRRLCVLWKNMAGFCSFKTRDIGKRMVEQLFGCCFSIAQSCLTLQPHNCSTPGFPVLHRLWELAQIHVGWVSDDIQPSHPLSPSPPAPSPSQHQSLFLSWGGQSTGVSALASFPPKKSLSDPESSGSLGLARVTDWSSSCLSLHIPSASSSLLGQLSLVHSPSNQHAIDISHLVHLLDHSLCPCHFTTFSSSFAMLGIFNRDQRGKKMCIQFAVFYQKVLSFI